PLHKVKTVIDIARRHQELMFAYLDQLPRLQAQRHDLSYGVAGERDVAWPLRFGDEDLQAGEEALGETAYRFEAELHAWMLPEQNVVLEVDRELVAEHNIDHGHEFAINRDGHIRNPQWPLGVMQFGFWYGIAEHAVLILFVLVWRLKD